MKKISFILAILISMGLSGCATSMVGSLSNQSQQRTLQFSDTLFAIGKPKTTIAKYPDALVLAGEKNYYLLTSYDQALPNIFANFNLNQLRILEIGDVEESPTQKAYYANVLIEYRKAKNQISPAEQAILQKERGGFSCTEQTSHQTKVVELECRKRMQVNLLPIKKPAEQKLQHTFSTPQKLNFYSGHSRTTSAKYLYPLALAVDIVTFPVQLLGTVVMIGAEGGITE